MARKYELETIPIWEAFDEGGECPLCILDERAEKHYLEFFLGNSVMIPEMRVEVNKTGFCRQHFTALWKASNNKHPLSLMVHTHMKDLMASIGKRQKPMGGSLGGVKGITKSAESLASHIRSRTASCMICDRLAYTIERYTFTVVYLWKTKDDFRKAFSESRGFCIHHLPELIEMAKEQLSPKNLTEFMREVVRLQEESFQRLEGELLWYTQKFDYQNNDKPWGTSKDALHRSMQKLTGRLFRE